MLSLQRSEIPTYLHSSAFYKSLSEDDDEEITVLRTNIKLNSNVNNASDFVHILSTARFWGLDLLPEDALRYAMDVADDDAFCQCEDFEDFWGTVRILKAIRSADGEQRILIAAASGRIDFLRYMLKEKYVLRFSAGVHAALNNQLPCLEFVTSVLEETMERPYKKVNLDDGTMRSMNYECWKYLHDHGASVAGLSALRAAESGNLPCLRFFHEADGKMSRQCLSKAVFANSLLCIPYIIEHGKVPVDTAHGACAAANGYLSCLKCLFEHGCPPSLKISAAAASFGHVECLKYAHKQGCPMNKATMNGTKSLDCIKYMREHGVKWDARRLIEQAISEELFDHLQYFRDQGLVFKAEYLPGSACTSDGEMLRFLYERGAPVTEATVRSDIIPNNLLTCLKIAIEFGYQPNEVDCAVAAAYGVRSMECLQLLHEMKCPWDASACFNAARSGQPSTLQYLLDNGCPFGAEAMEVAAKAASSGFGDGGLRCVAMLHKAGCPWDASAPAAAVGTGFSGWTQNALNTLSYLHEHGCPWDERTTTNAALKGCLEVLQYVRERGCPWRADDLILLVVEEKYTQPKAILAVVQYLYEQGCAWGPRVCSIAARKGLLDVLKFARENDCEWSAEACTEAVIHSHVVIFEPLACLRYLHENGCPWDSSASKAAAFFGNLECLTYLHDHGCPCDATTCAAAVCCRKSMECLQYLHEIGVPWDGTSTKIAAQRGDLQFLTYLLENGCPCDASTSAAAACNEDTLCLEYLHESGCPWDESTCTAAASADSLACLQFAHEHGCAWDPTTYQEAPRFGPCWGYLELHGCPRTAEETAALHAPGAQQTTSAADAPAGVAAESLLDAVRDGLFAPAKRHKTSSAGQDLGNTSPESISNASTSANATALPFAAQNGAASAGVDAGTDGWDAQKVNESNENELGKRKCTIS